MVKRLSDTELRIYQASPCSGYSDALGWYFPVECGDKDVHMPFWAIVSHSYYDKEGNVHKIYNNGKLNVELSDPSIRPYIWISKRSAQDKYLSNEEPKHTLVSAYGQQRMNWKTMGHMPLYKETSRLYDAHHIGDLQRNILGTRGGSIDMSGMYGVLKFYKVGKKINNMEKDGYFHFSIWDLWLAFTLDILPKFNTVNKYAWSWFFLKYVDLCKQLSKKNKEAARELSIHIDKKGNREYAMMDNNNNIIEPPLHIREMAKGRERVREWFVRKCF